MSSDAFERGSIAIRRRRLHSRPRRQAIARVEQLENRTLLAAPEGFARFEGTVDEPFLGSLISFQVDSADFALPYGRSRVLLGVAAEGIGANPLHPRGPRLLDLNARGETRTKPRAVFSAGPQGLDLFPVRVGSHGLQVQGKAGATGDYQVVFTLAGDVNQDFKANRADLALIRQARLGNVYDARLDVNGDGRVGGRDALLARFNLGAATRVRPLVLHVGLNPNSDPDLDGEVDRQVVTLQGQAVPRAKIEIDSNSDGLKELETIAASNGSFQIDVSLELGLNAISVRASDRFGQSAVSRITVNRIEPDVQPPVIVLTPPLSGIATNANVTITGRVTDDRPGAVKLMARTDSGSFIAVTPDANGGFQFTTTLALNGSADGPHIVEFQAEDSAGNRTAINQANTYAFTLDTIAPAAPAVDLAPESDTEPFGDRRTTAASVTIIGTSEAGATVTLKELQRTATANSEGRFSFSAVPLAVGANLFTFYAVDRAGNQSSEIQATLTRDRTPDDGPDVTPPTIVIESPNPNLVTNQNPTIRGKVTDDRSGIASFNAVIDQGTPVVVNVEADGSFEFTTSFALNNAADGGHRVTFTAVDRATIPNSAVQPYEFTLDTIAPVTATLTLDPASDDEPPVGDGRTKLATVALTGQTEPRATVTLTPGGAATTADEAGNFRFSSVALVDGTNSFTAEALDAAGNRRTSDPLVVTRLTVPSELPITPEFDLAIESDTGEIGDRRTSLGRVSLTGRTSPGAMVTLSPDGITVTADAGGRFRFENVSLASGENEKRATAANSTGSSMFSSIFTRDQAPGSLFQDPDLEAAVRNALGLPDDHVVTEADLAGLKSLSADGFRIESLVGLEEATNLESLSLISTQFATPDPDPLGSLGPLINLTNLASLALVGLELKTEQLGSLANLSKLKELDLRYNQIRDLGAIAGLPSLESLSIQSNAVPELSPLKGKLINLDIPTADIKKPGTIAEAAASLQHNPLRIYEFVRNSIEFNPYAGALKAPSVTLATESGNDWDQSALLIALLAEAGIEAKFVIGRIRADVDDVLNWLGVKDVSVARDLLGFIGLEPRDAGDGQDGPMLEFRRVLVEAQLAVPGRGVVAVSLDPSWKFKARNPGEADLLAKAPFKSGLNGEAGYLSEVRSGTALEYYEEQVREYISRVKPGFSIEDIPHDGPIAPRNYRTAPIATDIEYAIVEVESAHDRVPESYTYRINLDVLGPDPSGEFGRSILNDERNPNTGERLDLYPVELTSIDLSEHTYGFVAVPVAGDIQNRLQYQFLVDGQVNAMGGLAFSGTPLHVRAQLLFPGDNEPDKVDSFAFFPANRTIGISLVADDFYSVAFETRIRDRLNAIATSQTSSQWDVSAAYADLGAVSYSSRVSEEESRIEAITGVFSESTFPRIALTYINPTLNRGAGIQVPLVPDRLEIDVHPGGQTLIRSIDGAVADELLTFNSFNEINSSALEASVWEEVTNIPTVSTTRSIQLANAEAAAGGPNQVVRLDPSAVDPAAVPLMLSLSESAEQSIVRALLAGHSVITPTHPTLFGGFRGVGYIEIISDVSSIFIISNIGIGETLGGSARGTPAAPAESPTGNNPNNTSAGDPVNIANGNVTRDETDVSIPNVGMPLRFARHYDSQSSADIGLGPGWMHTFGDFLSEGENGSIIWTNDIGYRYAFSPDGAGNYVTPNTLFGRFQATADGFEYREKDGLRYVFSANRLTEIRDRYGNGVMIARDEGGRIRTVSDARNASRRLTFAYQDGRLQSVADFTGRVWSYGYDGSARLAIVEAPKNELTPESIVRYDYYDDEVRRNLLAQITEPNSGMTRYTYYPNRRAFQVTDAEGFTHSFSYDLYPRRLSNSNGAGDVFVGRTAFTNERGYTTYYVYNSDGNMVRKEHPDGAVEEWEWRDQLLRSYTDPSGAKEFYKYDDRGNVEERTDRAGIVTTTNYERIFNNLTSIIRPGERSTTFGYNAQGSLTTVTDALDQVTTYVPDSRGLVMAVTRPKGDLTPNDPNDYTTTFTYNDAGQVKTSTASPATETHPTDLLSVVAYDYDDRGHLTSVVDANGNVTTYLNDLLGRVRRQTDPDRKFSRFEYDAIGNLVEATDRAGRKTTYGYDLRQFPTGIVQPDNTRATMTYDAAMNLVAATDEGGRTTRIVYDSRNRPVSTIYADGATVVRRYDGNGRVVAERDPRGNSTRYEYRPDDQIERIIDADSHATVYGYDVAGNLERVTDRRGITTVTKRDLLDRVIRVEGPENYLVTMEYDPNGNLEFTTRYDTREAAASDIPDPKELLDDQQRRYQTVFDALDRPIQEIDSRKNFTRLEYDPGGRLLKVFDERQTRDNRAEANHNFTEYKYDKLDRLETIINAKSETTTYLYDDVGNVSQIEDALGQKTDFFYDTRDRVTRRVEDMGETTRYGYDPSGNLTLVTDAMNRTTINRYDTRDRLVSTSDANGAETRRTYDSAGNLETLTDPVNNTTTFAYDALNRLETQTNQSGDTRVYEYDEEGYLKEFVDREERRRVFNFDGLGRLEMETWHPKNPSDAPVELSYEYNGFGDMSEATAPGSRYEYAYDELGRLRTASNHGTSGVPEVEFTYDYDEASNLTFVRDSIAGQNRGIEEFRYDRLNRVDQIKQSGNGVAPKLVKIEYDAVGQWDLITRYSDLAGQSVVRAADYSFDRDGRLRTIEHERGDQTLAAYSYEFDRVGRIKKATTPDGTAQISYDRIGQLIRVDNSGLPDESYAYDDNGNRVGDGYQTESDNRLQSDGRYLYEYDDEGNRVLKTEVGTNEVTTYAWDHRNRLTSVTTSQGEAIISRAFYAYDAFDRRTEKRVNPDGQGPQGEFIERFVHDGDHVALQFDGAGNLTHRYLHGPAIDQILADENSGGNVLWPLTDHLGTVRDLVNSAGEIANHIVYDSFGNRLSETNSSANHLFGFTGREFDEETGLQQFRTRYYDTATGQFLGEDPIGFASGDFNLYRYVGNGASNYSDPFGLAPENNPDFIFYNPAEFDSWPIAQSPNRPTGGLKIVAPVVTVASGGGFLVGVESAVSYIPIGDGQVAALTSIGGGVSTPAFSTSVTAGVIGYENLSDLAGPGLSANLSGGIFGVDGVIASSSNFPYQNPYNSVSIGFSYGLTPASASFNATYTYDISIINFNTLPPKVQAAFQNLGDTPIFQTPIEEYQNFNDFEDDYYYEENDIKDPLLDIIDQLYDDFGRPPKQQEYIPSKDSGSMEIPATDSLESFGFGKPGPFLPPENTI